MAYQLCSPRLQSNGANSNYAHSNKYFYTSAFTASKLYLHARTYSRYRLAASATRPGAADDPSLQRSESTYRVVVYLPPGSKLLPAGCCVSRDAAEYRRLAKGNERAACGQWWLF